MSVVFNCIFVQYKQGMKTASVSELKKELVHHSKEDLIELINKLIKYSKENKELLHYLLFEVDFEENYVQQIKEDIDNEFEGLDTRSWKTMKKSIQRIQRTIKKHIKYSKVKQTEIELLLHFCLRMRELNIPLDRNPVILNIYKRQVNTIKKAMLSIHEDLQYDYLNELEVAESVLISMN